MSNGVKRVSVLRRQSGQGQPSVQVVYRSRERRKRKRQSDSVGWLESLTRNTARAVAAGAQSYVSRHQQSNRRRRDGWLLDFPGNAWTAANKAKRRFADWTIW